MKFGRKKMRSKYSKSKGFYVVSQSGLFLNFLDPNCFFRVLYSFKDGVK